MRSCGPNANTSVAALSTSPQSISYFEDSREKLTLKEFKEELSKAFESITGSHDLLEPQECQAGLIAGVFSRLHLDPEELTRYTHLDDSKNYTRNLVATDNTHYTLMLLCWNPGKSSPIHDHPCDGCWMQVLEGQVRECRYERTKNGVLKCYSDETFYEGQQLHINDSSDITRWRIHL
ncbi:alkanesulfonate biosynthetic process [Fragilaria crotonensis]|nr:alkanesulfonate biosynthetic process [Fragilaria crotonensis]